MTTYTIHFSAATVFVSSDLGAVLKYLKKRDASKYGVSSWAGNGYGMGNCTAKAFLRDWKYWVEGETHE